MQIEKTILAKGFSEIIKGKKYTQNYANGRSQSVKFLAIHYTGTTGSALNNLKYFASRYVGASAHLFIDPDGLIYQSVPFGDTAYGVGTTGTYRHATCRNSNSISIELVSDGKGPFTSAQIATLKSVIAELRATYNIPATNVLRHHDVTGKTCPAYYVNASRWDALSSQILGTASAPKPVTSTPAVPAKVAPVPAPKPAAKYNLTRTLKRTSKTVNGKKQWTTTGADVKELQKAIGMTGKDVDGIFGNKTHDAVKAYQKKVGFTGKDVDGAVGPMTAKKLGWLYKGK